MLERDGERVVGRGRRAEGAGGWVLVVAPAAERPSPACLERLAHEYALKDELDAAWAARPLELRREGGQTLLTLEDAGGEPLERLVGAPMAIERFLSLAAAIAAALGKAHQRGLVHKDVKPANILIDCADGRARLTGFGVASRLPRERQAPEPPEIIAGTLAYMAPEQTGRMNRSVDSRSDLYALGVTFYQMLTGRLPFSATDPMEWVHCHIARRPRPPAERTAAIPVAISDIVMKLLAKTAEERYQTAAGLERDLRRCLAEWERSGRVEPFALGERDTPDRLLISEKLYGREREVEALLAAFDRAVGGGPPELVLVSGYSGVGKSSVVNELHKALVPPRGLFAAGKFDQAKRDIPYATVAQAFQGLVRSLLTKSEAELAGWRAALVKALGPNGRLIVDLVPELALVIGQPPPAPELEPQQEKARFHLVFRRFIGAFATAEHPLALFLDDLQWLDAATLDLIEDLMTRSDQSHLLLIGAYRDNEVDAAHPLARKLTTIRDSGATVSEIRLEPLNRGHVGQLIADALHTAPDEVAPLAQLAYAKTGGSPFFVVGLLKTLADEGLLAFEHEAGRWCWNLDRVHAKGYADNVVDLMVERLARLPIETRRTLQRLACLSGVADAAKLAVVCETSEEEVHAALGEAVRGELIERSPSGYLFAHDRVREAAYSLIPKERRAETHLRIGRLLAARAPAEKLEEAIFDIVNQLNRGAALIAPPDERERLAELNLIAGRRAKVSVAYASALTYLAAGTALLPEDAWERRRGLIFDLELNRAECEFLAGDLASAEERLSTVSRRAADLVDKAAVVCLQIALYQTLNRHERAVEVGLECLRGAGIVWSSRPRDEQVAEEYERLRRRLGERSIESLFDLPLMSDPGGRATMQVLAQLTAATYFTGDLNLWSLVALRMANLSVERGNIDESCHAYVFLNMILRSRFGAYDMGYRFGRLGLKLVEEGGLDRFKARVCLAAGVYLIPWTQHLRAGEAVQSRGLAVAIENGDMIYAAYGQHMIVARQLAAGDPLADMQRKAEDAIAFARRAGFGFAVDVITSELQLIRTLRGLAPAFGSLSEGTLDEAQFERRLEGSQFLQVAACWYWIRKLEARFFANRREEALAAAAKAEPLLGLIASQIVEAEYHFYAALTRAALCGAAPVADRIRHLEALAAHHRRLQEWAANCAANFADSAALVGAEIARIEDRALDAEQLYAQAICAARDNGFVHKEALANELAGRFYLDRGLATAGLAHLRNARYGYALWGADGKVSQLDEDYPRLKLEEQPAPTSTIGVPIESLDLATVIKVSQAASSEIVFDKLIDTLMRTAIEQAGAERGVLALAQGAELRIAAEAATAGDAVLVHLRDEPITADALPESMLNYVQRTRESVVLEDVAGSSAFASDPYVLQRQARSILCLPLLNQAKLIGALYLENNLARGVFAPGHIAVLKLLAAQAAISLENTRLYRDLAAREAKIRRLVDANIIGVCVGEYDGRIVEANDAALRMLGLDRADLDPGRLTWSELTPPEWINVSARALQEARTTGVAQLYEKEFFHKNGRRVPAVIGVASIGDGSDRYIAFVLDLSERKRAEAALREAQMQLAHANRLEAIGQLTASIAHEVNQPIGSTLTNAQAALRWLNRPTPDLDEVRQALDRIVRDGARAGAVVQRIRGLLKKAPTRGDNVEINDAIREVIGFVGSEAAKSAIAMQTHFVDDLPLVRVDRVELQQVVLNLLLNAIEAMSDMSEGPRELLISTDKTDSRDVLVAVRDTGPGFAPAAQEKLFKAFYTTKPSGLGLGLSICRSIVEAHGGRLWASPNSPRGAVLQFTLPSHCDSAL